MLHAQVSAWLGDDGASASLDKDAAAAHAAQVLHQVRHGSQLLPCHGLHP
jgi:hypothetical protein